MKPFCRRRLLASFALILLFAVATYFRASGLYRGLREGVAFHPDTPKQIVMLSNYLQGRYVLYQDSLFYDGYPYGLNRVDEGFIRPIHAGVRAVSGLLTPDVRPARHLERRALYYWARSLRVLYGLATLLCFMLAARRLRFEPASILAGGLLLALAPLAATVTHSASGDVGVDLFLVLTLWCMSGYACRGHTGWVAAGAASCGMAFACKYQGGLGLWLVGMPPILLWLQGGERFRRLVAQGMAGLAGFAAGVLLLTPAFWINARRTWRDMHGNFTLIKDYGVPPEFLERPLGERVLHGLGRNVPLIAGALGWTLCLITLLALGLLVREGIRRRREGADDAVAMDRRRCVCLAAVAFPLLALVLSTAFKPAVQPFHFSYLLPFMALAATLLLTRACARRAFHIRLGAGVLIAAAGLEALTMSLREDFFWRRGETYAAAMQFSDGVFRDPPEVSHRYDPAQVLKHFFAEPGRLPVFRNRPSGLHAPDAEWWRRQHLLPTPMVPLPTTSEWIFMNGPVFPRSDRMFMAPAETSRWTRRTLVFDTLPEVLPIGLRTGRFPARYTLRCSGQTLTGLLLPHSQRVLHLKRPQSAQAFLAQPHAAFNIPLRIKSELGPVWVTVLGSDAEQSVFEAFGPHPQSAAAVDALPRIPSEIVNARLDALRYLELEGSPLRLDPIRPSRLVDVDQPLAAGAYRLDALLFNAGNPQRLRLALRDLSGYPSRASPFETVVPTGLERIEWRFEKDFSPFNAPIKAYVAQSGLTVLDWRIAPEAHAASSTRLRWHAIGVDAAASTDGKTLMQPGQVAYPGIGRWQGLWLSRDRQPGRAYAYAVQFALDPAIDHQTFHEAVLFLHLSDFEGNRVAELDYPLRKAAFADAAEIPWQRGVWPEGLPAGTYRIDAGVYNVRTRKRFAFRADRDIPMHRRRRYFRAAELQFGETE